MDAHGLVHALAPGSVKGGLNLLDGQRVVLVAVLRDDDAVVDDEEVHVGGDERLVGHARLGVLVDVDGVAGRLVHEEGLGRHDELGHLELAAGGVSGVGEGLVRGARLVVERVVGVVRPDAEHLAGSHEAGDVVDVAVGLLGVDAVLDPDDLRDVEVLLELVLHVALELVGPGLVLGHAGVAAGVEQAHLGGHEGALAVDVDGAALDDQRLGTIATHARELCHLEGDLLVLVPGEVEAVLEAAVGVEVPVDGADLARVVDDVGGAGVADPGVVGGHLDHVDVLVLVEDGLGVGVVDLVDAHVDGLELRDGAGDRRVLLLGGLGAPGPGVGAVRPGHPGARLRLELSRHTEAVGPWIGL